MAGACEALPALAGYPGSEHTATVQRRSYKPQTESSRTTSPDAMAHRSPCFVCVSAAPRIERLAGALRDHLHIDPRFGFEQWPNSFESCVEVVADQAGKPQRFWGKIRFGIERASQPVRLVQVPACRCQRRVGALTLRARE
jgi:hypothetical protein